MNTTYEVYARKDHSAPLTYIGSVEADEGTNITDLSLEKYGPESEWLEMVAVPQQAITVVFSAESEVNDG